MTTTTWGREPFGGIRVVALHDHREGVALPRKVDVSAIEPRSSERDTRRDNSVQVDCRPRSRDAQVAPSIVACGDRVSVPGKVDIPTIESGAERVAACDSNTDEVQGYPVARRSGILIDCRGAIACSIVRARSEPEY